ncbi:site-specific integrase [Vibrio parahaemolyticus]|uniref:site-specific integrase n=1 Tax=Vibrio parahaemolyticus TaxID=670 RepID=UPI000E043565|nr:site-specific integrase [Vibrio parahaemolyticus]EJG1710181.1 site-specific integrase [Vibrio parahaemolyticus]EJG1743333.1 site-specific integrase [Vibrio parahaemolyticus]EJG1781332.1 site-specific integrase [Vibrio parahaemolyticus]SUP28789.1 phage integrase family protein [Vibrio parahaemolyticus]
MFLQTTPSTGDIASHIINQQCLMGESGSTPFVLERPVPKSLKVYKQMTSFELADAYTGQRLREKDANQVAIMQDHQMLLKTLHFLDFSDLRELDRAGAECIRNALAYLPANSEKHKPLKRLNGYKLVETNLLLEKPYPFISDTTLEGYIHNFSSFLNWAKNHNHISDNVFYKLIKKEKFPKKKRFPFNDKQLADIFSMKDYRDHNYLHPYYYWIPLILRYSGSRLNEACQLYVEDIKEIDGIDCFHFHKMFDGQRIKTESSVRVVPIHEELIKKGFLTFVKSKKNGRLFPELPLIKGYYSNNASKWFSRRRKKLGLGKGFDAHSFRHRFINELKQKLVTKDLVEKSVGHERAKKVTKLSNELVDSIIGQEHDSESFDTYSEQYSPRILAPIINMIDASHTAHIRPYNLA